MAIGRVGSCNPLWTNMEKLLLRCNNEITLNSEMSPLEVLPQHILIKVLCGVDHEDLKWLFHVSKTIREATLIARELHFGHNTPKKKLCGLRDAIDMEGGNDFLEIKAPNAPLRPKRRLNLKKLEVSVALFADTKLKKYEN